MLKRNAAPANPTPVPVNADEIARVAGELRSGFADLQTRVAAREADGQTIGEMRAELSQHAQDLSNLQDALTRANRPTAPEIAASATAEQRLAAVGRWLRTGNPDELIRLDAWKPELATRAVDGVTGVQSQGGYLLLPNFDQAIERVSRIFSNVRQYARVVQIGSGDTYSKLTNKSGAAASWVGEEEDGGDADAIDWALNEIVAHEARSIPRYSRKALADPYFNLEAEIIRDLGEAFGKLEAAAQVNGTGVKQPYGFMNPAKEAQTGVTEVTYGKLGYYFTGHATDWAAVAGDEFDIFTRVQTALKTEYLARAAYYMNRVTLSEIMLFKDANDLPIWQPSMQAGVPSSLRGYPVRTIEEMANRGASTFPVTFGSMEDYYTILDRLGMEMLPNPYRTTGFTRFETYKRSGGKVMKSEAMKAIKVATS